jgi:hypothetical protein
MVSALAPLFSFVPPIAFKEGAGVQSSTNAALGNVEHVLQGYCKYKAPYNDEALADREESMTQAKGLRQRVVDLPVFFDSKPWMFAEQNGRCLSTQRWMLVEANTVDACRHKR